MDFLTVIHARNWSCLCWFHPICLLADVDALTVAPESIIFSPSAALLHKRQPQWNPPHLSHLVNQNTSILKQPPSTPRFDRQAPGVISQRQNLPEKSRGEMRREGRLSCGKGGKRGRAGRQSSCNHDRTLQRVRGFGRTRTTFHLQEHICMLAHIHCTFNLCVWRLNCAGRLFVSLSLRVKKWKKRVFRAINTHKNGSTAGGPMKIYNLLTDLHLESFGLLSIKI